MKIGLLGGSFNPPHEGHLHISRWAHDLLALDQIWWLVSPQNPLKSTQDMARFSERYQDAIQLTTEIPWLIVSDYEQQKKNAYTAITLKAIRQDFSEHNFVWLMGQDNWQTIHQWQDWEVIFHTIPIAVAPRDNSQQVDKGLFNSCPAFIKFKKYQEDCQPDMLLKKAPVWTILPMPKNPLSSTQIRSEKIAKNKKPS